uniref:Uncharacterized protein n=1 Tax=Populus trichocarpa TaxID=3694 RepID=B9IEC0_POPTR
MLDPSVLGQVVLQDPRNLNLRFCHSHATWVSCWPSPRESWTWQATKSKLCALAAKPLRRSEENWWAGLHSTRRSTDPRRTILQPTRVGLHPPPGYATLAREPANLLACVCSQARRPANPLAYVCSQAHGPVPVT